MSEWGVGGGAHARVRSLRSRANPGALAYKHHPPPSHANRRDAGGRLTTARVCPVRAAVVLERFSKFHRILESGINFIVPFMDAGR